MKHITNSYGRRWFWEYIPKSPGHKFTVCIGGWVEVVLYIGTHTHPWGRPKIYVDTCWRHDD